VRVLHLTSMWPSSGSPHAGTFVVNLVEGLARKGIEGEVLSIERWRSKLEYFRALPRLIRMVRGGRFDLVHAQYAHCVLVAHGQRRIPVIGHFHGELQDGHGRKDFALAQLAARLTRHLIVVDQRSARRVRAPHVEVIPIGVDAERFRPTDRAEARRKIGLDLERPYVLFSSNPARPEKDYPLFQRTLRAIQARLPSASEFILHGRRYDEVPTILNAVDVLLLTSRAEASPTVVKEALLCNLPVLSTDVGDVGVRLRGVSASAVLPRDPEAIAAAATRILRAGLRSNGRMRADDLDVGVTADRTISFYRAALAREGRTLDDGTASARSPGRLS
jgi:teichuronic acid biosynthesis glycosyltransferase TuaC